MDRKEVSEKIPSQELRCALEELRDTTSERRAQALKKIITDQLCEVPEARSRKAEARSPKPEG
jgi:hypothetical protein